MSPAGNKLDLKLQHLRELLPKLKPVERPFFDLTNPGWILSSSLLFTSLSRMLLLHWMAEGSRLQSLKD